MVRAVLYEGYALYPYRPSSTKNRHRFTFGGLVPRSVGAESGEAWEMQTQCLVRGTATTSISVRVRFLQLLASQQVIEREAAAHEATLAELVGQRRRLLFSFDAGGVGVEGAVVVSAELLEPETARVTVRVENLTGGLNLESGDALALRTLASTHTILSVREGAFISLVDPPAALKPAAEGCKNVGTWPVLAGEPGLGEAVLSSPIILYDYPEVAPESPGDLFDATEIDEILTLRILTLTDDEKREAAAADPRVRALLERTEALTGEDLLRLHGALRRPGGAAASFVPGDRVTLRPRRRADVFDIVLAGKAATIAKVERDIEGRILYAVTVDDDPGRDLGEEGRPAHRFFFAADEVERAP